MATRILWTLATALIFGSALAEELKWTPHPLNPVIANQNGFNGPYWNDPSVIRVGTQLVMYMSRNVEPIGNNHHVVPVRATSQDGVNWSVDPTPLLQPSPGEESFDGLRIETPSVIFHQGVFHMYYTGISRKGPGGPIAIGHAASVDGIHWTKDPNNPVLQPTGNASDWNGYHVGEPGAIVINGNVYVFFAAVAVDLETSPPMVTRSIGFAESQNASNFGEQNVALQPSGIYPASEGFEGYSTPEVVGFNGAIHLFYDVWKLTPGEASDRGQVALHHAVTTNGITWVEDKAPIFAREDFPWTAREIRAPAIMAINGKIIMWFAGDDVLNGGAGGIGVATGEM
jgi:predicted GH43/DUF377 family glycosyl hydrolase